METRNGLEKTQNTLLQRNLGPLQIQLISLGGVIGSAYFLGAGSILAENGPSTVLAFLLGGLIVWMVSMAMSELCVAMKSDGGFVTQARVLMGRPWAAAIGWSYWFNWCAYIPSEMIAGGLILHQIFPQIPVIIWSTLFASIITAVNLLNVKRFGQIEAVLSILKVGAMAYFTLLAVIILLKQGGSGSFSIFSSPGSASLSTFSGGPFAFLLTMVLVLVNFQGTELIALSAAETQDPSQSIPRAARNVAFRVIALYVVPLTLLLMIFPGNEAKIERSVFAEALGRHGYKAFADVFQLVIISAALSCANSGLYGAARSLYGLGKENLAPKSFAQTNAHGVPAIATAMTIGVSWAFLPLYLLFEGSAFYSWLLSVSGFTGAICWISISWCQIRLRQNLAREGKLDSLSYRMPGYPYLSWLSLFLQLGCLFLVAFHPTLRSSLILGIPAFVLPALYYGWKDRKGTKTERENYGIVNSRPAEALFSE